MTLASEVEGNPNYIRLLDHGFIGLVDAMPSEHGAGDGAIVQAARTSYGKGTKSVSSDEGLIRYLLRHQHTTPFEMVEFKLHIKVPIFVVRQHIRHRTANVNEYSGRYSEMSNEFYIPDIENIKPQSNDNKQGRSGAISLKNAQGVQQVMKLAYDNAYSAYQTLLGREDPEYYDLYNAQDGWLDDEFRETDQPGGIAKELARSVLPVANYTELYWKNDLNNIFKYLKLRDDAHAQYEIRVLAEAMGKLIQPYVPIAYRAYEDYIKNSENFSGPEMEVIRSLVKNARREDLEDMLLGAGLSLREISDFSKKIWK